MVGYFSVRRWLLNPAKLTYDITATSRTMAKGIPCSLSKRSSLSYLITGAAE
jgi:hypothetical protein